MLFINILKHNDPMNMLRGWREHFFCKQKYFCPIMSLSFLHPPLELSCGRRVGQGGGGGAQEMVLAGKLSPGSKRCNDEHYPVNQETWIPDPTPGVTLVSSSIRWQV